MPNKPTENGAGLLHRAPATGLQEGQARPRRRKRDENLERL